MRVGMGGLLRNFVLQTFLLAGILGVVSLPTTPAAAEDIKIGVVKIAAYGPIYIAIEKGYFRAEGLNASLVFFNAGEPIAVATVSGDIDFGVSGTSAGLYSLAGKGALRIITAGAHENPGFQFFSLIVSNRAYEGGLKSYANLAGHSVAVSQIGSPSHYSLALIEEKYRIDPKSVRVLPLQGIPNQLSAVIGGQADATVGPATAVMPVVQRGDAKLLGFIGDAVPWQVSVGYTATKTADAQHDRVERFLRAYRKGVREYHDAFTSADGKRADGPDAPEILNILAKYTGQSSEQIRHGISYIDPEARLDVGDIRHQIEWFQSQGMLKGEVDANAIIDKRYVTALPGQQHG